MFWNIYSKSLVSISPTLIVLQQVPCKNSAEEHFFLLMATSNCASFYMEQSLYVPASLAGCLIGQTLSNISQLTFEMTT